MVETWLVSIVSYCAIITSVAQFSIGILICRKIFQKGNTSDIQFFPLLALLCSCTVWFKYGLVSKDMTVIVVNFCGIVLQSIYVLIYYCYTTSKSGIHRQILIGAFTVFPILTYLKFSFQHIETIQRTLGFYCCAMSVISYSSPLSSLAQVIRRKTTSMMSFPFVLCNTIVGCEWLLYGILVDDPFIKFPNCIGFCMGLFQLLLFAVYPSRTARVISTKASQVI